MPSFCLVSATKRFLGGSCQGALDLTVFALIGTGIDNDFCVQATICRYALRVVHVPVGDHDFTFESGAEVHAFHYIGLDFSRIQGLVSSHGFQRSLAERTGYASASTFTIAFSRHVGVPPARYARGEAA